MSEFTSFEYVNLNEIDPNQESIPAGMYTYKILKAEHKSGVSKTKQDANGQAAQYEFISVALAIQDDPKYSGRRLWESFFPNSYGMKALRRIMDSTGVQQAPGQPLDEWLTELSLQQPTFKAPLNNEPDLNRDGTVRVYAADGVTAARKNSINAFNIVPA